MITRFNALTSGGDLRSLIQDTIQNDDVFSYKQVRIWMIELCDALKTIHKEKIVHRDIKPENVFLVNNQYLKIGDLGISRKIEQDQSAHTRIGTPRYLAPEVYNGDSYSFTADIWSLGMFSVSRNAIN